MFTYELVTKYEVKTWRALPRAYCGLSVRALFQYCNPNIHAIYSLNKKSWSWSHDMLMLHFEVHISHQSRGWRDWVKSTSHWRFCKNEAVDDVFAYPLFFFAEVNSTVILVFVWFNMFLLSVGYQFRIQLRNTIVCLCTGQSLPHSCQCADANWYPAGSKLVVPHWCLSPEHRAEN
jgi:hypothetical protein